MDGNTLKNILLTFSGVYLFTLALLFIFGNNNHRELPSIDQNYYQPSYKFDNPKLAYEVLSQLEVFDESNPYSEFQPERAKETPYLNLKNDDHYCDKRRAYFVLFPEVVFEDMPYLSDMIPETMIRNKMLIRLGTDVQPNIGVHMPTSDTNQYDIDPAVTNFLSRKTLNPTHRVGKHFSCLSQISSHVAGKVLIDTKYKLAENSAAYAKKYADRPQCFNVDRFVPKTYLLYEKESCLNFFEAFNSPAYQRQKEEHKIVYLKKIGKGLHMGAGVEFVTDSMENDLRTVYANGANCGKIPDLDLIQNYVPNPLLLNGRKFDFRSYMLIASANPLIAYYHDATLRVSLMQYDVESNDKKTLLTNIALNKDIYNEAKEGKLYQGMSELDLKLEQQWTFSRFQQFLLENGVVNDPAWFDEYLRPQFKRAMIHLLRLGILGIYETSTTYSLYGLDFMLDSDMHLWFVEANSAPGMAGFSEPVEEFVLKMLKDEMEIVMGLLRSRMKRVINFVNTLTQDGSVTETEEGDVIIRNKETNQMIFNRITENFFEDEFMPSPNNGFSKIIDGNYKGTDQYLGFISAECL